MSSSLFAHLEESLENLRREGLFKEERILTTPQDGKVSTLARTDVVNLCANNYLGLANHPQLIDAAQAALHRYGYGMASVRFICGTQDQHQLLEKRLASLLGLDDTILYSSCFDANTGLFETLLGESDAIISDALNHASIIDGVRLCKARRLRYANNDMAQLEAALQSAADARFRLIATDGVFSMDGSLANLPAICELASRYDALVMVDDSHAVGILGEHGGGTPEHFGVQDHVHIVTGTLGKALGGASGGYTSGHHSIINWLRQRSRPYLFSNSLAPPIVAASLAALDLACEKNNPLRNQLWRNAARFREALSAMGFKLLGADHPIIPVWLGDATLAGRMSNLLFDEGIYAVGFSYPVVPPNQARIRTQMSAALSEDDVERAIAAFEKAGKACGAI